MSPHRGRLQLRVEDTRPAAAAAGGHTAAGTVPVIIVARFIIPAPVPVPPIPVPEQALGYSPYTLLPLPGGRLACAGTERAPLPVPVGAVHLVHVPPPSPLPHRDEVAATGPPARMAISSLVCSSVPNLMPLPASTGAGAVTVPPVPPVLVPVRIRRAAAAPPFEVLYRFVLQIAKCTAGGRRRLCLAAVVGGALAVVAAAAAGRLCGGQAGPRQGAGAGGRGPGRQGATRANGPVGKISTAFFVDNLH